jgi:hypothetical protein
MRAVTSSGARPETAWNPSAKMSLPTLARLHQGAVDVL